MDRVELGLKNNWQQFTLLVIVNLFVGGMVGLERTILPQLAEEKFHLEAKTAILAFIIVFGVSKALTNYFMGSFADQFGRKNLLVMGWLVALPIPFILIHADQWSWVILANALLGINQGLTWSSTVIMKIDLVGEKNRGLAMGLNESAGYLAVGAVAFLTGWLASEYGLIPYPFYVGIVLSILGLVFSVFLIKDTKGHVAIESRSSRVPRLKHLFMETTWTNNNLGSITQAGFVNNLNDGMIWGLFPILLSTLGYELETIGLIVAVYPTVWGLGQLFTGRLADIYMKKRLLFIGMFAQGMALFVMIFGEGFWHFIGLSVVLGLGTALVYPTFLAGISAFSHPEQRAKSIGVFRLWRDLGYAIGALLTGIIADTLGIYASIGVIGVLTFLSALIIHVRMDSE